MTWRSAWKWEHLLSHKPPQNWRSGSMKCSENVWELENQFRTWGLEWFWDVLRANQPAPAPFVVWVLLSSMIPWCYFQYIESCTMLYCSCPSLRPQRYLLPSDIGLLYDAALHRQVEKFALDQAAFFAAFSTAAPPMGRGLGWSKKDQLDSTISMIWRFITLGPKWSKMAQT